MMTKRYAFIPFLLVLTVFLLSSCGSPGSTDGIGSKVGPNTQETAERFEVPRAENEDANIPLSLFSTQVGTVEADGSITSNSAEGHLTYGPYLTMLAGRYTITMKGTLLSGNLTDASRFDVYSNETQTFYAELSDLSQYLNGNSIEFTVPFTLMNNTGACEFRLYVNAEAKLRVTGASIRYVGEPQPDALYVYNFNGDETFDFFGFSGNEGGFRWTGANLSAVAVDALPDEGNYVCRVVLGTYLPTYCFEDGIYEVSVTLNDLPESETRIQLTPREREFTFPLDRAYLGNEESFAIVFRSRLWEMPSQDNTDPRRFGIPVERLLIVEDVEG